MNTEDPFTLLEIEEIPVSERFTYKDSQNFCWTFHAPSLARMNPIMNPCTRQPIPSKYLVQLDPYIYTWERVCDLIDPFFYLRPEWFQQGVSTIDTRVALQELRVYFPYYKDKTNLLPKYICKLLEDEHPMPISRVLLKIHEVLMGMLAEAGAAIALAGS